ncbi:hypothetical protein JCM6882_009355 [Rhodosporidiobolus microsporus]
MPWRSHRSRRSSSHEAGPPGEYGIVNLLQTLDSPDHWEVEIHADIDKLREQLRNYVRRKDLTLFARLIARGVASLLEALLREASSRNPAVAQSSLVRQTTCKRWMMRLTELKYKDKLKGGPIEGGWWQYYQVELEPYETHLSRGHLPGQGLEGHTVWYRRVDGKIGKKLVNNGQHQLTDISFTPHDCFGQKHLGGSYFLNALRPDDLPHNPSIMQTSDRGLMAGFFCQPSAPHPKSGREQAQWRWFWGSKAHDKADIMDFERAYSGRMEIGPSSAAVVFVGAVNLHQPVQRAGHERGRGMGVLKGKLRKRRK